MPDMISRSSDVLLMLDELTRTSFATPLQPASQVTHNIIQIAVSLARTLSASCDGQRVLHPNLVSPENGLGRFVLLCRP